MSVLNTLEVANFLNLDEIPPNSIEWEPGYVHNQIHFRGQSTALVATNGLGKTTLTKALFSLLSRDPVFTTDVRSVAARRDQGFSHIRIEVLYRDKPATPLEGRMGIEIPGEPYVFGMYLNSGQSGETTFYCYQGNLSDCPVAITLGTTITLLENDAFRKTLRSMRDVLISPNKDEWIGLVNKHFDRALLDLLLAYQKSGAGDSNDDLFKVKRTRSDGRLDDYDTAFFYNIIAPECLNNAMAGFGEEGEVRFEDTILNSAAPLVQAELAFEKSQKDMEKWRETHRRAEQVKVGFSQFKDARRFFDAEVSRLAGECQFILDLTEKMPIMGVPPVLSGKGEKTLFVANRMVVVDGEWCIPDSVLAEICGEPVGKTNQRADRNGISATRTRQVIDIPWDSFSLSLRGPRNRAYSIDGARTIISHSTEFGDGWSKDLALRALNLGFDLRTTEGEKNPFRITRNNLKQEIRILTEEDKSLETKVKLNNDEIRKQAQRVESLSADEYALKEIRESGDFSDEELQNIASLPNKTTQEQSVARNTIIKHSLTYERLTDLALDHETFTRHYPGELPSIVLPRLQQEVTIAETVSIDATAQADKCADALKAAENARDNVRDAYDEAEGKRAEFKTLTIPVDRFRELFGDIDPHGLPETVSREYQEVTTRLATIDANKNSLENEVCTLRNLREQDLMFREIYPDLSNPAEAENIVKEALSNARAHLEDIQKDRLPAAIALHNKLASGQSAMHDALDRTGLSNPSTIEETLRTNFEEKRESLNKLTREVEQARRDEATQAAFEDVFPNMSPLAVRAQRNERYPKAMQEQQDITARFKTVERQINDLKRSALSPGQLGNMVIEVLPAATKRVHIVLEEHDEKDPERRALLYRHFSHVLHAPVVESAEEASSILLTLEKHELEAPVFWKPALMEFCRSGAIMSRETGVIGFLVGMNTLQVESVLDPAKVEERRRKLETERDRLVVKLQSLKAELETLEEGSSQSTLVRSAIEAIERGLVGALPNLLGQKSALEKQVRFLDECLTGAALKTIRAAAEFVEAGGDAALAAAEKQVSTLREEVESLSRHLPDLERRAAPDRVQIIRKAVEYQQRGGDPRISEIDEINTQLNAECDHLNDRLPSLKQRLDATSDIRAAIEYSDLGGDDAFSELSEEIEALQEQKQSTECEYSNCATAMTNARQRADMASHKYHEKRNTLTGQRSFIERAIKFVSENGPSFISSHEATRDALQNAENRAQKRASYRFDQALRAEEAEQTGEGAASLRETIKELEERISDANARRTEIAKAKEEKKIPLEQAQRDMETLDDAVAQLLRLRRDVHTITDDIDFAVIEVDPSSISAGLAKARSTVERLRQGLAECEVSESQASDEIATIVEEDVSIFDLDKRATTVRSLRKEKEKQWNRFLGLLNDLVDDRSLSINEGERTYLLTAQEPKTAGVVDDFFKLVDGSLHREEAKHESLSKDIESRKEELKKSLNTFTLRASDNFALLKKALKPNEGEAGFLIEASVIDKAGLNDAVVQVIKMIKAEYEARAVLIERGGAPPSQGDFEERMRSKISETFYRAAFTGTDISDPAKLAARPVVRVVHPSMNKGKPHRLNKDRSTGQRTALWLVLMTRLADFAIRRDERIEFAAVGRRRKAGGQNRVVFIDGLFSNLSDRKMIRASLDSLRGMGDRFQLIGLIHNTLYENDTEIFPSYVALRRLNNDDGFVVQDNDDADSADGGQGTRLGNGHVATLQMHADPLASAE